ncbi:olfactory receptor 6M1-like [Terrapene carolina triunguis]|uniref:olfactory receptor 6M1-like n=1 Tax=Terrapene triunguis TaxID=2587831 RepID=UPI0011562FD2|nr:olfactory receptor 6M1-like [Terrapene carolina triunguis]
MYFFLLNLSLLETCFISSIVPVILRNLLSQSKAISFSGCIIQCFFYFFLGITAFTLLFVVSFDGCLAIYNTLRYPTLMNSRVCIQLVLASWLESFLLLISPAIILCKRPYCHSNAIDHFFCDAEPLSRLSCADTRIMEVANFLMAEAMLLGSLMLMTLSYVYIMATVLRIPSASGRCKAFSIGGAHITVASIFMHVRPSQARSFDIKKAANVLTTVVRWIQFAILVFL